MSRAKPSVCFVALKSYGILAEDPDVRQIGGAEVQQVLVARELARRGHAVSFVVHDYGQPDGIDCDGITVYKKCAVEAGWPMARFVYPQTASLWRAMGRADADIYYQRGAGSETGQVAGWCSPRGRPFVFGVASDTDCDRRLPYLKTRPERLLYRFGVRRAQVICQTVSQQRALRTAFSIDATLVRSCTVEPPPEELVESLTADQRPRILWIGRLSYEKRPELLLDVAEDCPGYDFDIVGAANATSTYAEDIVRRAEALSNVTLHGVVPYGRMGAFYSRSAVLMCTSLWEGYPNTFLEAWARGVPTVSTVDPDGVVAEHGLGLLGETAGELSQAVHGVLTSSTWSSCSGRGRRFYLEHHTVAHSVDAYEQLFEQVSATSGRGIEVPVS